MMRTVLTVWPDRLAGWEMAVFSLVVAVLVPAGMPCTASGAPEAKPLPVAEARPAWLDGLPESTWALLMVDGATTTGTAFQQTPLGRLVGDPNMQKFFNEGLMPVYRRLNTSGEVLPPQVSAGLDTLLRSAAGGRFTVAVLSIEPPAGNTPPQAQVIVSVEPRAGAADFHKALQNLLANLPAGEVKTRKLAGVEISTLLSPAGPVSWGRVGNDWVLTLGQQAEDIVFAAARPQKSLYGHTEFRKVGPALRGDGKAVALMSWLNLAAVRSKFEPLAPPTVKAALDAMGITGPNGATAVGESIRIEAGQFVTTTALTGNKPTGGLMAGFTGTAMDSNDLKLIPRTAPHFVSLSFDPGVLYDSLLTAFKAAAPPEQVRKLEIQIEELSESLDVKFREELLAALSGRVTLVGTPDDALPLVGGTTLVLTPRDHAKLAAVAGKLRNRLGEYLKDLGALPLGPGIRFFPRMSTRQFRGYRIDTVNLGLVAPAWTLTDKHLVIGVTPQALMDYLNFLSDKSAADIQSHPDFAARLKGVGGMANGADTLIWTDLPRWFPDLHAVLTMFLYAADAGLKMELPLARGNELTLRPELFPAAGQVSGLMTSVLCVGGWRDGAWVSQTVSPVPMPPPVLTNAVLLPGLVLPAVSKVRQSSQLSSCANSLRQLGIAAHAYALDHNNLLPNSPLELADYVGGRDALDKLMTNPASGAKVLWFNGGKSLADLRDPNRVPLAAFLLGERFVTLVANGAVFTFDIAEFRDLPGVAEVLNRK